MALSSIASWLTERSPVPLSVLEPVAAELGLSTNYLGAALFAGQLAYQNQDAIVEYASKSGSAVGEFLHAAARRRYGPDHPLTEYLGENAEAISEAFEGTEREAETFAEFYRRYRAVDRTSGLRDGVGGVVGSVRDRVSDAGDASGGGRDAVHIPVSDAE